LLQDDIEGVIRLLHDAAPRSRSGLSLTAIPIYAAMPHERQMAVFEKAGAHVRKVIVATNIAETSITIPGIVYVVDSCFVKVKMYRGDTGMDALVTVPVSRSSAMQVKACVCFPALYQLHRYLCCILMRCTQRAGRAGRVQSGKAFRLVTEEDFKRLPVNSTPEMQRTAMAPVILQLKALGIHDVVHFPFLSPPPADAMLRGLELLYALGALDDECRLVKPVGAFLAELPCDALMGKMLWASCHRGCSEEILSIAAMMSVQNIFVTDKELPDVKTSAKRVFGVKEGDHLTLLNIFNGYINANRENSWCGSVGVSGRALSKAFEIRGQLCKYIRSFGLQLTSCGANTEPVLMSIVEGYFSNAARRSNSGGYLTLRGSQNVSIHSTSILAGALRHFGILLLFGVTRPDICRPRARLDHFQ
jgi:ATP-dependent RNA helicase DDX35